MLARVNANSQKPRSLGKRHALSDEKVFLNEFNDPQNTQVFGEGEPAEYVFQIVEGAVRSHKLLSDGRRPISAFHLPGDIFDIETTDTCRFTAEAVIDTTVRIAKTRTLFEGHSGGDAAAIKNVLNLVTRSLQHAEKSYAAVGAQDPTREGCRVPTRDGLPFRGNRCNVRDEPSAALIHVKGVCLEVAKIRHARSPACCRRAATDCETRMPDCIRRSFAFTAAVLLAALVAASPTVRAQTLTAVKERGTLNCGVGQGLVGFSSQGDNNNWTGLDVDICRAIAAAIFGDPSKVTFTPLDAASRFGALQSGKIDVLSRNSTWTMSRETSLGLMFAGVAYYDGQGFLLRREVGIDTALQLGGKTVCTQTGTTSELNLSDYFRANDMPFNVLALGTAEESRRAYDDRKCDVLTSDISQLYAERLKLAAPDSHIILPEVISKEPLGPVVRQGDDQWFNLVKWTLYSLINAEELGVKSATIDDALKSSNPEIRRLVGGEGEFGQQLGLEHDWAARAVRAVGNYGEIYERNIGTQSRLSIPRGLNALWTQGGIQYAPPIR